VVYDDATGNRLDVYMPPGDKLPVVVFFFGGRWSEGDKQDYKFVGQALAARGIIAVIPNYRLYPRAHYQEILDDSARAVAWVHAHIGSYNGNAARIVVMGHSTGAWNAAMLALDPQYMVRAGGNRNWIRGMVGLAGPYDFLPITDPDLRDLFGPPETFDNTQPVFHVDGNNPPLLLMHGGKDETVNMRNTESLFDRVKRANGNAEKVIYPDLTHSRILDVVGVRMQGSANVMDRVDEFVQRVSAGNAPSAVQPSSIQTYVPPK
jgi:acetyl esterase/lipase